MGREARARRANEPPDPPVVPFDTSIVWFESKPDPINKDPELATLMVCVGMASNALLAQLYAGRDARQSQGALRLSRVLASLTSAAAVTHESTQLVRGEMARLRPLVSRTARGRELLRRIGKLCGGKHPSATLLLRARNNLGFHWDPDAVAPTVRAFSRNKNLVWLERTDEHMVHRLAADVLALSLIPYGDNADEAAAKEAFSRALDTIDDAIRLMLEFFAAATYGYLNDVGAKRRTRGSATRSR